MIQTVLSDALQQLDQMRRTAEHQDLYDEVYVVNAFLGAMITVFDDRLAPEELGSPRVQHLRALIQQCRPLADQLDEVDATILEERQLKNAEVKGRPS